MISISFFGFSLPRTSHSFRDLTGRHLLGIGTGVLCIFVIITYRFFCYKSFFILFSFLFSPDEFIHQKRFHHPKYKKRMAGTFNTRHSFLLLYFLLYANSQYAGITQSRISMTTLQSIPAGTFCHRLLQELLPNRLHRFAATCATILIHRVPVLL